MQMRMQSIPNDIKFNEGRMQCKTNSVESSFWVLGSTGLVVERAMWKKVMARYIGLRFHAATKVLVVAQELAKAKRYELKQNAEFNWL